MIEKKDFERAVWIAACICSFLFWGCHAMGWILNSWVIFLPLMILIAGYLIAFMFMGILSLVLR